MAELRLFGYFDSYGASQCAGENLQEILSENPAPDEAQIVIYLKNGIGLAGCGGVRSDILNPSLEVHLGADIYTDGVWAWPEYLAYYVEKYHARIPKEFLDHMKSKDWRIPHDFQ